MFHSRERDRIDGFVSLFRRRMEPGKNADRMIVGGKDASLCNMIAFFVNIFCGGALGTIADNPKSLKFITIRFYDVAVIDVNNSLIWNSPADQGEIRIQRF